MGKVDCLDLTLEGAKYILIIKLIKDRLKDIEPSIIDTIFEEKLKSENFSDELLDILSNNDIDEYDYLKNIPDHSLMAFNSSKEEEEQILSLLEKNNKYVVEVLISKIAKGQSIDNPVMLKLCNIIDRYSHSSLNYNKKDREIQNNCINLFSKKFPEGFANSEKDIESFLNLISNMNNLSFYISFARYFKGNNFSQLDLINILKNIDSSNHSSQFYDEFTEDNLKPGQKVNDIIDLWDYFNKKGFQKSCIIKSLESDQENKDILKLYKSTTNQYNQEALVDIMKKEQEPKDILDFWEHTISSTLLSKLADLLKKELNSEDILDLWEKSGKDSYVKEKLEVRSNQSIKLT